MKKSTLRFEITFYATVNKIKCENLVHAVCCAVYIFIKNHVNLFIISFHRYRYKNIVSMPKSSFLWKTFLIRHSHIYSIWISICVYMHVIPGINHSSSEAQMNLWNRKFFPGQFWSSFSCVTLIQLTAGAIIFKKSWFISYAPR